MTYRARCFPRASVGPTPHVRRVRTPRRRAGWQALEPLESRILLTTFTVTTALDVIDPEDGLLSLREAIIAANDNPNSAEPDRIEFNIPGAGVRTIAVQSALPAITDALVIDGYTQPGASPNTLAIGNDAVLLIELDGGDAGGNGLTITGGDSIVRGLVINGFSQRGILIEGAGGNLIEGNFIGTDPSGALARPNEDGIDVRSSANNTIGGVTPQARNLVSGNEDDGIRLTGPGATGNRIENNYVGTNAAGTAALGNGDDGIDLDSASFNFIIGNVSSGNGDDGLELDGGVDRPEAGDAEGNVVQGNFIGTNAAGTAAIPNADDGIDIDNATNNLIGGATPEARNLISGNGDEGIVIRRAAANNRIQGNFIGVDVTGNAALGNGSDGIQINHGASDNLIGGDTAAARNVISGNGDDGVAFENQSNNNRVQGNFIGLGADGQTPVGNDSTGVLIRDNAFNNLIGGAEPGQGNVIAHNGGDGVAAIHQTLGNAILGNSIFLNSGLGIDLGGEFDGITPNDPFDADAGPNGLQNFPVITGLTLAGGQVRVQGTLASTPDTTFRVEVFASDQADPSGFGEGQQFLGALEVTTNGAGDAAFDEAIAQVNGAFGPVITATATGPDGTSEFSQALLVGAGAQFGKDSPSRRPRIAFTDADGTTVIFTLKGPGIGTVTGGNGSEAFGLSFTGTTRKSAIVIKVKGGADGKTLLNGVSIDQSAKSFTARNVELQGDMLVQGVLRKLLLGDVNQGHATQRSISILGQDTPANDTLIVIFNDINDLNFTSAIRVKKFTARHWVEADGGATPDTLQAPTLDVLLIKGHKKGPRGDFEADVMLVQEGFSLKQATIKGLFQHGSIRSNGLLGNIAVGAISHATIFSRVDPGVPLGELPTGLTIGSGAIRGFVIKPNARITELPAAFVNAHIAAATLGQLRLTSIADGDAGAAHGFAARTVKKFRDDNVNLNARDLEQPGVFAEQGLFGLRIV